MSRQLWKNFRVGSAIILLGNGSHILNYITLLYLARNLHSKEFAVYGYTASLLPIIGVVSIILPDFVCRVFFEVGGRASISRVHIRFLEKSVLIFSSITSLFFFVLVCFDLPPFRGLSFRYVLIMVFGLLAVHLNGAYSGILNARRDFVLLHGAVFLQNFIRFSIIIVFFAVMDFETAEYVLAIWGGASLVWCWFIRCYLLKAIVLEGNPVLPFTLSRLTILNALRVGLPVTFGTALILFFANFDTSVVGQRFSVDEVSEYAAAASIAKIPFMALQALSSFLFVKILDMRDGLEIKSLIVKLNGLFLVFGIIYLSLLFNYDGFFYLFLLGGRHEGGLHLLRPLAFTGIFLPIFNLNMLFTVALKCRELLLLGYGSLFLVFLSCIYFTNNTHSVALITAISVALLALCSYFIAIGAVKTVTNLG